MGGSRSVEGERGLQYGDMRGDRSRRSLRREPDIVFSLARRVVRLSYSGSSVKAHGSVTCTKMFLLL